MDSLKFIVYSDIHYDRLGARCVTIEDCEKIEREVHKRVIEGDFDFSIFCGDRFLKREPEDEVKTRADFLLFNALKHRKGSSKNASHFHLIGNHDWVSKSMHWHTSESLDMYCGDSVFIMDGCKTCFDGPIAVHALPSGSVMDMSRYAIKSENLNILVFHDMVYGCKLDDSGNVIAGTGLKLEDIDRPEFDLVMGGDIHVPQRLPFKNTQGGYVGAVMQRNRGDANQQRGWLEVCATKKDKWYFDMEFVPTRPFFTRSIFNITSETQFESLKLDEVKIKDTAVEVELRGEKKDVDRIASDAKWKNYEEYYGVRSLDILRRYRAVQSEVVVDFSKSFGVMEDLKTYLDSGFVDLGNIPKQKLLDILQVVK